jgi:hypothetical protein
MANPKDIEKEVRKAAEITEDALRNITANIRDIFEDALNQGNTFSKSIASDINKNIKSVSKTAELFEGNLSKLNKGQLTYKEVQKQIEQRNIKIKALEIQKAIAIENQVDGIKEVVAELDKAIDYNKLVEKSLKEQATLADKIQQKLGNTGKILKGISKIPILGNFLDAEEALTAAQEEAAQKGSDRTSVMSAAFKSLGTTLRESVTDPLTQITLALGFFKTATKYALEFNDTQIKLQRALLISSKSSRELVDNMQKFARESNNAYVNYVKLSEANIELNEALDTNVQLTAKQLEDNIQLKEVAGLEVEERAALYKLSVLTGKTQESIFNTIGKQNKGILSNKKVLSEVLKTSGQLAAQYKNNPELLARAVIQAQKLGTTLEKTKQISSQLLNFEDSIASELEAELLTGMDLNLEKARYLALQGDSAAAAQELLANMGPNGLLKFQNMNVIQQESLAKALGMGVDELADTLVKQDQLSKMTASQRKDYEKSVELAKMERSEREKTAQNIENLKKTFFSFTNGPIATVIKGFNNVMEGINNSPILKSIIGFTGGASALIALGMGLVGSIKLLTGVFSKGAIPVYLTNSAGLGESGSGGIGGNFKRATTAFSKGGMKGGLKSLGRIGKSALKGARGAGLIGTGIGLAAEIAEGGLTLESLGRAGITGLSSFAGGALGSLIAPGVGTIAGGVGGGLAGDKIGDLIFGERKEMARGGIVSKPTRAIVGEAGTEAVIPLDKFYAKLDELISVVKSGGHVYLDGNKVGTTMTVGTYRTQ